MEKDKDILNQLKKTKKPNVPNDFFEQFTTKIMSEVKEEKSILNSIKKQEQPKVPAGFFDEFSDNLKLNNNRKSKIITLKYLTIITAIAASFLLIFILNFNSSTKTTEHHPNLLNDESTNYQEDEYLSYLDEDDLVEFIIENDININNNIYFNDENQDDLFDELETELDDYIYEL